MDVNFFEIFNSETIGPSTKLIQACVLTIYSDHQLILSGEKDWLSLDVAILLSIPFLKP